LKKLTIYSLPALLVLIAAWLAVQIWVPWPISLDSKKTTIHIQYGMTPEAIADSMESHGIIRDATWFLRTTRLYGTTGRLRAGVYSLETGLSSYQAMQRLTHGSQKLVKVTFPEGLTLREMAGIAQRKLEVDSSRFVSLARDSVFIQSLNMDVPSLLGYLFPETYFFSYGVLEKKVLRTLVIEFSEQIPDSLRPRAQELGFTFHEIVTLASIIEGEAVLDEEKPLIASVYHNRLGLGMPLQADPTIQYIIPDGPRRLLHRDLEIDSPYNTYLYPGLPPGPISNPGKKAILAALYPAESSYLYFVADGTGGHTFSEHHSEHLQAKRKFDRIRAKVAKERRQRQNEHQ
jgi:UPF0755 protein